MIMGVPTTTGDSYAPPRPDRGTTYLQLTAPSRQAVRLAVRPADRAPDAVPLPAPADLPVDENRAAEGARAAEESAEGAGPAEESAEARGCLFALSQPPLMLFLTVIGGLIGLGAAWDLLFV